MDVIVRYIDGYEYKLLVETGHDTVVVEACGGKYVFVKLYAGDNKILLLVPRGNRCREAVDKAVKLIKKLG